MWRVVPAHSAAKITKKIEKNKIKRGIFFILKYIKYRNNKGER